RRCRGHRHGERIRLQQALDRPAGALPSARRERGVPGLRGRPHGIGGRRIEFCHRADGAHARALSRHHRRAGARRAQRGQRGPHRAGDFGSHGYRSRPEHQGGRWDAAKVAAMSVASGLSYWDATLPSLVLGLIAVAVLPWLDRNNTIARTVTIGICLFLAWRYMLWRITQTLPPVGLTLDFAAGAVFTAVEMLSMLGATVALT